jgi:hypothetical protein
MPYCGANVCFCPKADIGLVRISLTKILPAFCPFMKWVRGQVYITRKIIPADYATFVRDYARGNLDEAELWEELTTAPPEIEWHIANPGRCWGSQGAQMDEELKDLFFGAIGNFPPERQDAALADAGAELPPELQEA